MLLLVYVVFAPGLTAAHVADERCCQIWLDQSILPASMTMVEIVEILFELPHYWLNRYVTL